MDLYLIYKKIIKVMTISITDSEFNDKIKSSDKLILVDFWAEWCNPCKSLAPALAEASDDFADKIIVYKMNIDENPETPQRWGVRGVPTILFFKGGELVDTQVGALAKSKLYEKIQDVFSRF
jgi:thioredoxin 1